MPTDDVLVITDENGNIYNVTADLLKLARITNETHIDLVKNLTGNPDLCHQASYASFGVVGTYKIQDNKFIQQGAALGQTYTSPKVVIELGQINVGIPPS